MLVGVVGVALVVEMFAPQIAVKAFPEPVGSGGVGLEQHVEPQPVGVYPGDAGTLGRHGGLPLDDGGQRDQTPYLVAPGRARTLAAGPERGGPAPEVVDKPSDDRFCGGFVEFQRTHDQIGVREQEAFRAVERNAPMPQKGGVMDELVEILETHHLRLFQPLAHFPPGEAFGNCYPVEQGGTVDQLIDDLLRRPARVEPEPSGFERVGDIPVVHPAEQEYELVGIAHGPEADELRRQGTERRAGIDGHFHVLRGRDGGIGAGAVQKVIGQPTGSAASQQDQQHEPEQEARPEPFGVGRLGRGSGLRRFRLLPIKGRGVAGLLLSRLPVLCFGG